MNDLLFILSSIISLCLIIILIIIVLLAWLTGEIQVNKETKRAGIIKHLIENMEKDK